MILSISFHKAFPKIRRF